MATAKTNDQPPVIAKKSIPINTAGSVSTTKIPSPPIFAHPWRMATDDIKPTQTNPKAFVGLLNTPPIAPPTTVFASNAPPTTASTTQIQPSAQTAVVSPKKKSSTMKWIIIGVVVFGVIGTIGFFYWRQRRRQKQQRQKWSESAIGKLIGPPSFDPLPVQNPFQPPDTSPTSFGTQESTTTNNAHLLQREKDNVFSRKITHAVGTENFTPIELIDEENIPDIRDLTPPLEETNHNDDDDDDNEPGSDQRDNVNNESDNEQTKNQ